MSDLFSKRMDMLLKSGSLGGKLLEDSDIIDDRNFTSDTNYKKGMLYDWDMNELEEVEFKFEKTKTWSAGNTAVEYMIRFRPNYNPEYKFKDLYYKKDGRERFGFYIDVLDVPKKQYEKWLIMGKDDRVAFDRYNAFKCDWCFEWVDGKNYHNCLGCVRDAKDGSMNNPTNDGLGGTLVNDEISIIVPTNENVAKIKLGTRFMIGDSAYRPQVYEAAKILDTAPLGTTEVFMKQRLFNEHTDVYGIINDMKNVDFCFNLPIDDLPANYGGNYHMICDCVSSKSFVEETPENIAWKISCDAKYLYVNGQAVIVKAIPSKETTRPCAWHVFIDGKEYGIKSLTDYFDIHYDDTTLSIKAINKVMEKYIVKVAIWDEYNNYYDSVEMEVRA